jgi:hypothetical protein
MLRRAVKFTKGPFSYCVELECGHTVRHKYSRRRPRRKHCPKCYIANKIVQAKEKHPELFEADS